MFDLDGTLFDSTAMWEDLDRRFLLSRGVEMPPDYPETIRSMEFYEGAVYTVKRFGLSDKPIDLVREWSKMSVGAYVDSIALKDGARQLISALKEKGVKLAVATSSLPSMFVPALKRNGIFDAFDALVSTGDVGRGKNDPAVYVEVARQLGLDKKECAVFEDSVVGATSAKRAGFYVIGVYDRGSDARQNELRLAADLYVTSLAAFL